MKLPKLFHGKQTIASRLTWRVVGWMTVIMTVIMTMMLAVFWLVGIIGVSGYYRLYMEVYDEKINNEFHAVEVAMSNNVPEVATMSASLAGILRTSISERQFCPLSKELELVQNYCEIQTGNVLVEYCIEDNSVADGKQVGEIEWPADFLIVSVRRGDQEAITVPSRVLRAGDYLIGYQPKASAAWNDELMQALIREQQQFG